MRSESITELDTGPLLLSQSPIQSNPYMSGIKSNSFTNYVPLTILMMTFNRRKTRIAISSYIVI